MNKQPFLQSSANLLPTSQTAVLYRVYSGTPLMLGPGKLSCIEILVNFNYENILNFGTQRSVRNTEVSVLQGCLYKGLHCTCWGIDPSLDT